ncbi:MAG: sensor domain-containing diguanylate cyclase [Byssovorax sp.]
MRKRPRRKVRGGRLSRLEKEVASLRAAIELLHRISGLVGSAVEVEPTCYAILTGVTAGVGLGLNRAMIFLLDGAERLVLRGKGAIGPASAEEADRVWKAIEADSPDLITLYEAGLHRLRRRASVVSSPAFAAAPSRASDPTSAPEFHGALDRKVRALPVDTAGNSSIALALRRGEMIVGEGADDLGGLLHLPTGIAAPLRDHQIVFGVLYADNYFTEKRLAPISRRVFSMVADEAGRAIANAQRYEKLVGEARTDPLTGLGHHGAFAADLAREVGTALSAGRPVGLLMIDLDGFKEINDRHGHLIGDAILSGVAGRLRGVIRGGEGVYRYGGDEFAVLLPGATRAAAALIAERVLRAIGAQPFAVDHIALAVRCSIGVASAPHDAHGAESLVEAADRALLAVKRAGKNAVREAGAA